MFDEFKSAFSRPNNGLPQLIVINVTIYFVLLILWLVLWGNDSIFLAIYNQFAIPPAIREFITKPWTLVTYMFTHSMLDVFHILFNMLFLYWFGKLFVEYLGSDKLIALYVLGGLVGGASFLALHYFFPEFVGDRGMVGASGAIFAIVVATAALLPDYTFYLMLIGPVKIKYIAAFYVVLSVVLLRQGVNVGGNIAHLGGAMIGYVYIKQLKVGVNWAGWITSTIAWVKGLFSPRQNVKVSYRKEAPTKRTPSPTSGISQQEIDAILDKISEGGYESLSKDEREKLFKASKK